MRFENLRSRENRTFTVDVYFPDEVSVGVRDVSVAGGINGDIVGGSGVDNLCYGCDRVLVVFVKERGEEDAAAGFEIVGGECVERGRVSGGRGAVNASKEAIVTAVDSKAEE